MSRAAIGMGIVAIFCLGTFVWIFMPGRTAMAIPERPRGGQPIAAKDGAGQSSSANSDSAAAAAIQTQMRWQAPRFIDGNFRPLSLSVDDAKAVLLTTEIETEIGTQTLTVFDSVDGGQSWARGETLNEYMAADGDLDLNTGDYALLGCTPTGFEPDGSVTLNRSELRVRKLGGKFSEPVKIWAAECTDDLLMLAPKLICASGGMWAFQARFPANTEKIPPADPVNQGMCHMRVAHSDSSGNLKPLAGDWLIPHPPGGGRPVAWAKDEKIAGFVTTRPMIMGVPTGDGGLIHYVSRDGGGTWQSSVIPFVPDTDSEKQPRCVLPTAMTRDGDTLLLTVVALSSLSDDYPKYQSFTLVSSDLGMTWGTPYHASLCDERGKCASGAHILSNQMVMGEGNTVGMRENIRMIPQMMQENDFSKRGRYNVRMSDNGGKSWLDQHAFEQLGEGTEEVVLSGSRDAVHVAIFRGATSIGSRDKGCLIIRTFSNGAWADSKEPAPAWFKESSTPQPSSEKF